MRKVPLLFLTVLLFANFSTLFHIVHAQEASGAEQSGDAELAQELTNPVADLMTIPIQMNYDRNIGRRDDGWKVQTNIQPVIPFHMSEDWLLITRTILPVIYQKDVFPGSGTDSGLGDTTLSLFISPRKTATGGGIWGIGPIFLLPTATDSALGADKWGAGPTAIALTLQGPWTMGILANHVWSFAGDGGRRDISNTFLQPFVAYTTPSAWTVSLQTESTYNWRSENWSVPVNATVSKLVRWGKLPVSLQAGAGYWVESPNSGPEGWRLRLQVNFVLPK